MVKLRAYAPMNDFLGGLNEDTRSGGLAPNELRTARNVCWRNRSLATRPRGSRVQSSAINSGADCSGLFEFTYGASATSEFVGVFEGKFYEDVDTASPTDRTGAVSITADATQVTFITFNDVLLMCNAAGDAPWKWSGSGNAAALGGSPPSFKTMVAKWNRVFGAGHTAAIRTIRYSALGDHETWAAANTVPSILDDASSAVQGADMILQLGDLGDSLFVGLRDSIGRVLYTGDSVTPFKYDTIAKFGVLGRNSYVPFGTGGYFLSERGVHYVRPSDAQITYESSIVKTPAHLATTINLARAGIELNGKQPVGYRASFSGNTYIVWRIDNTYLLLMRVTDGPGHEAFVLWDFVQEIGFVSSIGVSYNLNNPDRIFLGDSDGFVWNIGVTPGVDPPAEVGASTTAYPVSFSTRWEDFGKPGERKNLRDIFVQGDFDAHTTTAPTLDVYFDRNITADYQASLTTNVPSQHVPGFNDGTIVSVGISSEDVTAAWTLDRVVVAVESAGEYDDADTGG